MIDIEAVLERHLHERAERARPHPARELLDEYPSAAAPERPDRTRMWAALAAAAMVAVAVPFVVSDRDDPAVSDAGEAQAPRYRWAANGALLTADTFMIEADGRTFTPPEDGVEFNSDPSREGRSIELIWTDGQTEMRLNVNFATDGEAWWVDRLWTYNGLTPGDWIEFQTPLFRTLLTEDFRGDIDLSTSTDGHPAHLVLTGVTLQGFGDLAADGAVLPTTTTTPTLGGLAGQGLNPAPPLDNGLPTTGRYWTPEDSLVIALAEDQATRACMTTAGFDYPEFPVSHWASFGGWEPDPVMGIRRVSAASVLGYHSVDRYEPSIEATTSMSEGDRNAYYAVLNGDPSTPAVPITRPDGSPTGLEVQQGGCLAEAGAVVNDITYSQEAFRTDLEAQLGQDSLTMAVTDQRVNDALVAWRNCVTTAVGGDAAAENPDELARRYAFEQDAATPEEIEVAVADATCQQQTELQTIFYGVATEYDRSRLGDAVADYDAMLRLRVDAIAAARTYLQANNIDVPDLSQPAGA